MLRVIEYLNAEPVSQHVEQLLRDERADISWSLRMLDLVEWAVNHPMGRDPQYVEGIFSTLLEVSIQRPEVVHAVLATPELLECDSLEEAAAVVMISARTAMFRG